VVALRLVENASRYGAAIVDAGRIQGFTARGKAGPGLINAGCYLVARNIFERYPMPPKFSWEEDFLQSRSPEVLPIVFECDVPFIDIGIPESLREAQTLIPEWISATA
jgi:D-glycero-alpha-D-manno-heptose 1-phosphate guanylyltransferase